MGGPVLWLVAVIFVAMQATSAADVSGLTLNGPKCGQFSCNTHEYCSSEFNRCSPCDQICTLDNHNYDTAMCERQCQNYLHDMMYVKRTSQNPVNDDEVTLLRETVQRLQFQVTVVLIISCVVLILLGAITAVKCWKYIKSHSHKISWIWNRKKHQNKSSKSYPTDLTHQNPHTESPKMPHKPELKIDMPPAIARTAEQPRQVPKNDQPLNPRTLTNNTEITSTAVSMGDTSTPKTISTTISNRYPAEDSTLDYSYDNMAMNTPSPNINPTNESQF